MTYNKEYTYGLVVDVNDPLKLNRIKVAVLGYFDTFAIEDIPWALPLYPKLNTFDLPPLNSTIHIEFKEGMYRPFWYLRSIGKEVDLSEEDYPTGNILINKDLSEYGDKEGSIKVSFTETNGFVIDFVYGDAKNSFQLRNDNTIALINDALGKMIHISNESISLGNENVSDQPAVLGDDNQVALENLNNSIDDFWTELKTNLTSLSTATTSSPYTAHLTPIITQMITKVTAKVTQNSNSNKKQFPDTLSKLVTLNKE